MAEFPVGSFKVDARSVNPELIRTWTQSGARVQLPDNPSPKEWEQLADRTQESQELSEADFQQMVKLGKACFRHHQDLHRQYRDSEYKDPEIRKQLADVHVYLRGSDALRKAVKISQAQLAVEAAAGASFGPAGLVTAYLAAARFDSDKLKQPESDHLVQTLKGLEDRESPLIFEGNKAQGYHAEQIWPQMVGMLEGAIKAKKPTEINAQYYELTSQQMVGLLAQAAEAGHKVRLNLDGGRLVAYSGKRVEINEVPDKLRTVLQLSQVKGDIGISLYPVAEKLGDPSKLMHRKGLRVGEQFFLSGMNANLGSGENIDAGYTLEGPVAKQLVSNFRRDVKDSAGASSEQIYGQKPLDEFVKNDINMGSRGLIALLDCLKGPSPAGSELPSLNDWGQFKQLAQEQYGQDVSKWVNLEDDQAQSALAAGQQMPLSLQGKKAFLKVMNQAIKAINAPENRARLEDISLPKGTKAGEVEVGLADLPVEREALLIQAIQEAKEFIYVPAFVMTAAVAEVLVAKKAVMEAQGHKLDIRVLADPGIYPDGGTPNDDGIERLEDAGIACRWANLARSGWHDRKIHAKQLLTDQGEFFGSTNFSKRGLQENWEHSGYVRFEDQDSRSQGQQAKEHFLGLWDHESFEMNSLERGRRLNSRDRDQIDYPEQVNESRYGTIRKIIGAIENAEKDTAQFIESRVQLPKVEKKVQNFIEQGYDLGDARLLAVQDSFPSKEDYYAALDHLPARQDLKKLY